MARPFSDSPSVTSTTQSSPLPRPKGWWFSSDEKRGFSWSAVVGHDYKAGGVGGFATSALYLYLGGALVHLTGTEADEVFKLIPTKVKGGKA